MIVTVDWPNLIGFLGMACIIFAYAYMTARKDPDPYIQHGVNLAGAALLTVSLYYHPNLPSLVLEGFWAAIAIWGLIKTARTKSAARRQNSA
ncbi:permease [Croceicoccus ponticola]|uniref:Permease n=1 Tax=Croceicoccus ponticola TaxID=2217664 RepID=A0A437GZZ2_9SPHN|nr:permease [Croceicoccus ponticola]RVQ68946.1 permease [Croceicoccus ponticola]